MSNFRMRSIRPLCASGGVWLFLLAANPGQPTLSAQDETANDPDTVSFARQIAPIFKRRCYSCHAADKQQGGLRLDRRRNALAGGDNGPVVRPGKSGSSRIVALITEAVAGERMPPKGPLLSAAEVDTIRRWIDQGAVWPQNTESDNDLNSHWSFQPVAAAGVPRVKDVAWPRNAIDRFVLKQLERQRTHPSGQASRAILIRRVYLDLIGLPPSPEEWMHWIADPSLDWYPRLVDQLLASPQFGERWGRVWLDLARYADTDGYEKDRPRPHAYHWRDWVLDAVNRDLPFDQFTEQQLAGDLLPGATQETRLATGFHRNTLTNREGGIDKEEDRVKQAVDRVNTVATVWLGLTVQCAQCHSHKYDPVSHREYYQLYSFFNNADESDIALAPTPEQSAQYARDNAAHQQRLLEKRKTLAAARAQLQADLPKIRADYLARFPGGQALPPRQGLQVHAAFDADLRGGTGLQDARWLGSEKPTFAEGKLDMALQFGGSGERVELGRPLRFQSDKPFTIAAWIRWSAGVGAIVTKMDEAADFRGVDFTNNQGMLELHLVRTWPGDAIKVTTKSRVKKDEWHHVMVSYDGSRKAAGIRIDIDGKSQQLTTHYDALKGSIDLDEPLRVGSRKSSTFFNGRIDEVRIYDRVLAQQERLLLAGDSGLRQFLELAQIDPAILKPEQLQALLDFLVERRETLRTLRDEVQRIEKNPAKLQQGTGMALVAAKQPRRSFVHIRGEFLSKGSEVTAGVPEFLHPLRPRAAVPDRLDLARWILDSKNPLTSRVAVNRLWQQYFGQGLVRTSDDFGTQGTQPTHPALLDWMATRFVENGWSVKWLHREIVTSATYRQSSVARPELAERDPYNTWLARQNRLRVEAEIVRDLALATSGLLHERTHGPSVFPPLPDGTLELAFVDVINRGPWKVSPGRDRYRRGLYTFFQRTSPYPMLSLFDAPDSNTACTHRETSNTPLQALTLWNDPVFVECAQFLARRVLREAGPGDRERVETAFITALSRKPTAEDQRDVVALLDNGRSVFANDKPLARALIGSASAPSGMSDAEFAAWVSVARTLMNLDEFITRE